MTADLIIIGGGAAGLATGIFAARAAAARSNPRSARSPRIVLLDGARTLGAKLLVAGGGRCNVTNVAVQPSDFAGGSQAIIRRVLASLPVSQTVAFFREIGVELYEDYDGKLFPKTDRARTVLDALLREAHRVGVNIRPSHRVVALQRASAATPDGEHRPPPFRVTCQSQSGDATRSHPAETHDAVETFDLFATFVVLATGGLSLPKTGSDGGGYALARALGHSLVPTTPALDPLLLDGSFHKPLSGVSHPAELTVIVAGEKRVCRRGALLWTHFGVSGPVALDVSRFWNRGRLEGKPTSVRVSFLPGETLKSLEAAFQAAGTTQPKASLHTVLAARLPARVASALIASARVDERTPMAHLPKADRRALVHALLEFELPVRATRGYNFAEVTAGGVPLGEIDGSTMESRVCKGLFLAGEILDVDGRIGGFNFQWAWASGFVAGSAIGRRLADATMGAIDI